MSGYTMDEIDRVRPVIEEVVRDFKHDEIVFIMDSGGGFWQTKIECGNKSYEVAIGIASYDEDWIGVGLFDEDGGHLDEIEGKSWDDVKSNLKGWVFNHG